MKLIINDDEYWIKDGIELPSNFNSLNDHEKWFYILIYKLIHRENAPAIIYSDRTRYWWLNGKRHRIDGPAYISSSEYQAWYLNDIMVDGRIYKKIQNSSKEELLVYMIDPEYKDYLPLIGYQLKKG